MKHLYIAILFLYSCSGQDGLRSSIIDRFGEPTESQSNDRYFTLLYKPKDDSYFTIARDIKQHIDKEIQMLPTEKEENKSYSSSKESYFYDYYIWENPEYKITLENHLYSIKENKYTIRVIVENK